MRHVWCRFRRDEARVPGSFRVECRALDLAIAKVSHDLEHFCPGGEHLFVDLFVGLDCHAKFELLGGHFAFLCCFAIVTSPAPRPAPALKARVFAALNAAAPLGTAIRSLGARQLPALQARAAIDDAVTPIRPFDPLLGLSLLYGSGLYVVHADTSHPPSFTRTSDFTCPSSSDR